MVSALLLQMNTPPSTASGPSAGPLHVRVVLLLNIKYQSGGSYQRLKVPLYAAELIRFPPCIRNHADVVVALCTLLVKEWHEHLVKEWGLQRVVLNVVVYLCSAVHIALNGIEPIHKLIVGYPV